MGKILDNTYLKVSIAAIILGTTALCIFTPDIFLFKRGANFTVQIMILFLMLGMGFLVINQKKLMFTSLLATGLLCLHLKNASDQSIRFPNENTRPQVSVAHIDLSLSDDYTETMHTIWSTDVDVISFQEYTPDWHNYLQRELAPRYPYHNTMTRIDPFGMALYSKYPLSDVDTLVFQEMDDIPALYSSLWVDDDTEIHFITTHTVPAINHLAYERIREHFTLIGKYIEDLSGPVITLGDFSLPSWSSEIKDFKLITNLHDSRRDIVPAGFRKAVFAFRIPIEHIFYSSDIECTSFRVINSKTKSHLGIIGKYQLKEFASLEPVMVE